MKQKFSSTLIVSVLVVGFANLSPKDVIVTAGETNEVLPEVENWLSQPPVLPAVNESRFRSSSPLARLPSRN